MNFLGREIDDETVGKIKSFMNTREGMQLKAQLENMSKDDIKKLLENAKGTALDENKLKAALGKSPQEILKGLDLGKLPGEGRK